MTIDELLAASGLTANDEIPIWDAEATGEPTKKIVAQNLAAGIGVLGGFASESELSEFAPKSDLTSIIATGTTNTTGATITAGTYFYLNGTLVRALTDIASGATFTSGTNYEAVTAGGLNSLFNTFAKLNGTGGVIVSDYNNITSPGVYFARANNASLNVPIPTIPGRWYLLIVLCADTNYLIQIAWSLNSPDVIFFRGYFNTWTAWKSITGS